MQLKLVRQMHWAADDRNLTLNYRRKDQVTA